MKTRMNPGQCLIPVLLSLLTLAPAPAGRAQTLQPERFRPLLVHPGPDTPSDRTVNWQNAWITGGLAGTAGIAAFTGLDRDFRDFRQQAIPAFRYTYDDYLQYAPAAVMLGLKAAGVQGRTDWVRMLSSDALSVVINAAIVNGIKYTVCRPRPDGSARNSFPSGHTTTAFMTATMLHKEYGETVSPWIGMAGYAMATTVGISRLCNDRHWLSDVLAGAGIGILSVELGYWAADLIFRDKRLLRPAAESEVPGHPSFLNIRLGSKLYLSPEGNSWNSDAAVEGAWFFHPHWGIGGVLRADDGSAGYGWAVEPAVYAAWELGRHIRAGVSAAAGTARTVRYAAAGTPAGGPVWEGAAGAGLFAQLRIKSGLALHLYADYDCRFGAGPLRTGLGLGLGTAYLF